MKALEGTYFGNEEVKTVVDGIILSRYNYMLDATPWHYHSNPYFMFVLEGNMKDTNRQRESLCPAGSLMYNNWDEPHFGSKHSQTASGFHLEVERNYLIGQGVSLDEVQVSQKIQHPAVHFLFVKLYWELCISDSTSALSIETLTLQILSALKGVNKDLLEAPPWIDDIKEILHYDSSHITLKGLSEEVGVHPVHISRTAPQYLLANIGEYRRMLKIQKAIPHLWKREKSLSEIAHESGFSDQSHFNRVFKLYFSETPSSFRKGWFHGDKPCPC